MILKPHGLCLESKVSIILDKISNCRFGAKHGELPFLRWSEMWWAAGFVNSFKNRDQDLFTFHIHPQANAHLVLPALMTGRGGSFFSISFKICLQLSGFLIHPSFPFFSLTHKRCELWRRQYVSYQINFSSMECDSEQHYWYETEFRFKLPWKILIIGFWEYCDKTESDSKVWNLLVESTRQDQAQIAQIHFNSWLKYHLINYPSCFEKCDRPLFRYP